MEENGDCLHFDLIIRNGRDIDPASGLDIIADDGITTERIASVEPILEGKGFEELDTSGCTVTPAGAGIIDP